jgi:ADP-heptose:LPS heptosyltransferase
MRSEIIATHGLGDLIMASPLLRAVTKNDDDSVLVVVRGASEKRLVDLIVGDMPATVEVRRLDALGSYSVKRFVNLVRLSRRFRPSAYAPIYGVEPRASALLGYLSGAKVRVGAEVPGTRLLLTRSHQPYQFDSEPGIHKVEYSVFIANLLGRSTEESIQLNLNVDKVAHKPRGHIVDVLERPFIAVAFGSGGEGHKRLPKKVAIKVVRLLESKLPESNIVLLGTKAERRLNRSLADIGEGSVVNLTERTSLEELIYVLQRARLLVATCNGISHIGAASGCHVVGIYGPTNPGVTGPFENLTSLRLGLDCSPCYRRRYTEGCGRPICMKFGAEQIASEVMNCLENL